MFDRRLVSNFDWTLFLSALMLSVLGIVNLYSAGSFSLNQSSTPYFLKQLYWLLIALFVLLITVAVDYQLISRYAYLLHCASLLLLLASLLLGKPTAGTHRWLQLGALSFQPSELSKISF
jgi:rod shape determining protein RodA